MWTHALHGRSICIKWALNKIYREIMNYLFAGGATQALLPLIAFLPISCVNCAGNQSVSSCHTASRLYSILLTAMNWSVMRGCAVQSGLISRHSIWLSVPLGWLTEWRCNSDPTMKWRECRKEIYCLFGMSHWVGWAVMPLLLKITSSYFHRFLRLMDRMMDVCLWSSMIDYIKTQKL